MTMFCGFRPSIERGIPTEHNIHIWLVVDVVSRSAGVPGGAKSVARPHISSIPKPWQCRVHRSLYVKTPQPVSLDALRFLAGEHGVMAVSVVGEDRVVVPPHPNRVGESSMVGQP